MNYKIRVIIISLLIITLIGGSILDKVKADNLPITPKILPELPDPGILPDSFWYFLDIWSEDIEEFFTFNPERKAILQTERALERIAEVNALLEEKGVGAPGLDIAEAKIQRNIIRASEILERERVRGIEVSQLAKKLDDKFDARQDLLESVFDLEETRLEVREKEIKVAIREARLAEDFEKVDKLRVILVNIEIQEDTLDVRKDFLEEILEIEEEKIEVKMEARERELETLAEKAEDLFDQREKDLERAFEQKEKGLELQEKALEIQLKQAILVEDVALVEQIRVEFLVLELKEEALEVEEEALEENLEQGKRKLKRAVAMEERAVKQIEKARDEILDIKEEITEMIEDEIIIEIPTAVLELISEAESKLVMAEQAFEAGNYGKAFGQAMVVEMLTKNVERILEEYKEAAEKLEKREERIGRECRVDADCINIGMICPMVIGGDTPQCDEERGVCICGPSWEVDRREKPEAQEELTEMISLIEGLANIDLDDEIVRCIDKCLEEIKVAKICVQDIVGDDIQDPERLLGIFPVFLPCFDKIVVARNCFKQTDNCYQLFLDKLKENDLALYERYIGFSLILDAWQER